MGERYNMIIFKLKSVHEKMQITQNRQAYMQNDYCRKAEHKLFMKRFVADKLHCYIFEKCAAEKADKHQRPFGDTPTLLCRRTLVLYGKDNAEKRHRRKIYAEKIKHCL